MVNEICILNITRSVDVLFLIMEQLTQSQGSHLRGFCIYGSCNSPHHHNKICWDRKKHMCLKQVKGKHSNHLEENWAETASLMFLYILGHAHVIYCFITVSYLQSKKMKVYALTVQVIYGRWLCRCGSSRLMHYVLSSKNGK